ncbi:hypothetical protein HOB10_03885 [Candidatus Parcubacteria bacterium]|jgi:hypothetical protein|nr:hypothetical protein [Candidatus Parcubacteria bacterium]
MPKKTNKEHKPRKKEEGFGFHTVILITIFLFVIVTFVVIVLWLQMEFIISDIEQLRNNCETAGQFLKNLA